MNRQGQPVRGIPGFPGQQAQQSRINPLGGASGWGFGMQNGAPGLGLPQTRTPGASASFAQSIGGSQSSTPLDLSEFPSLSGAPQTQFQNAGQAVWSNQRSNQPTPLQRQQQSQPSNINSTQQQASHQAQDHPQQSLEDTFFPNVNMNGALEDFRHGGQGGIGQLTASGQPQPGSIDEFPPLGRLGHGEIGQDRRMSMMQNAAGGGFPASTPFGPRLSRGPGDALRQTQDKNPRILSNGNNDNSLFTDLGQSQQQRAPNRETAQVESVVQNNQFIPESAVKSLNGTSQARSKSPSQMSELDRFGLNGLLDTIRNESSDMSSLAIGHDLTTLGLDLNSSEPLHPSFAGPFAQLPTRPLQPDYVLPPCYTVANTHPVEEKIPGLSDETLLWIFYNLPRDLMQEHASVELTQRNWRYHKVLGVWITKEQGFGEPQPIAHDVERGRYIVFNNRSWQRESREMILRYADLDDHITNAALGSLP